MRVVPMNARNAGRDSRCAWLGAGPLCQRDPILVWSAHAGGNPTASDRSAEQAVAVDRFAREIEGILRDASAARSRQLNGKPLGGSISWNVPE